MWKWNGLGATVKMKTKNFVAALLAGSMMAGAFVADASQLDAYRNILASKHFTIKYEIVTPQPRHINRDIVAVYEGELLSTGFYLANRQYKGIVVSDGKDRYTEVCYEGQKQLSSEGRGTYKVQESGETATCVLVKGDDRFFFTRLMEKGKPAYYGTGKKGKIESGENIKSPYESMMEEMEYGNSDISPLLAGILPPNQKVAFWKTPNYQFEDSGYLDNGFSYEDYASSQDGRFDVVRYYFLQGKLVKIASASYTKNSDGSIDRFNKCIANITEFSPVPEIVYLSLPQGVQDVTKRDEKKDNDNE